MRFLAAGVGFLALGSIGGFVGVRASRVPTVPTPKSVVALAKPDADRLYLNGTRSGADHDGQSTLSPVRSLLNIKQKMRYGDYVWDDKKVAQGPVWVRVDLGSQLLSVFRAGNEIGTAVILYGATQKETPLGVFPILAKMSKHRSSSYDAEMPYTLRLTNDGISIHASDVRWGRATHGCIGVPFAFAQKLFDQVARGDKVLIVRGGPGKA